MTWLEAKHTEALTNMCSIWDASSWEQRSLPRTYLGLNACACEAANALCCHWLRE